MLKQSIIYFNLQLKNIHENTEFLYNHLVNDLNNKRQNRYILLENLNNSIENFILYKICKTISLVNNIPLFIKRNYKISPKYIDKDVIFISKYNINKKIESFFIPSSKMLHYLDMYTLIDNKIKKEYNNKYTKIDYYPFLRISSHNLSSICRELFHEEFINYKIKDYSLATISFYDNIYNNKYNHVVIDNIYSVYNFLNKPIFLIVNSIKNIKQYYDYINNINNYNVIPIYINNSITKPIIDNDLIYNYYQKQNHDCSYEEIQNDINFYLMNEKNIYILDENNTYENNIFKNKNIIKINLKGENNV